MSCLPIATQAEAGTVSVKKFLSAVVLAAIVLPAAPALADPPPWALAHWKRAKDRGLYDNYGRYYEPRRLSHNDRIWRGDDCRRDNGTTGLIIGAAVGTLVGRELDGGRDRTVGTIIGAAGGGLLGRAIDSGELKCR